MRRRWIGIVMATIVCLGVAAWAQQGRPRPGPGSGVVTVEGTVEVGNSPAVRQEGDWKMAISCSKWLRVCCSRARHVSAETAAMSALM